MPDALNPIKEGASFWMFLTLVKQHKAGSCFNFSMRDYTRDSRRGIRIRIRHKRHFGRLTASMQDELNSLFDEVLTDSEVGDKNVGKGWPAMHVSENAKTFNIRIEAPCMLAEDFDITMTYDFIIIAAQPRNPEKARGQDASCVFFHRTLSLPETAIAARATATFGNGILSIIIPKGIRRCEVTRDNASSN